MEDFRKTSNNKWNICYPIKINREKFLDNIFDIYARGINYLYQPSVTISPGINKDGPEDISQEYFTLVLSKLKDEEFQNVSMFEGLEDYKLPTPDITLLNSGIYTTIGKILGHAAVHSNIAYVGISNVLSNYIFGNIDTLPYNTTIPVEEVPYPEMKSLIQKGKWTQSTELGDDYFSQLNAACSNANFHCRVTPANLKEALHSLIYSLVYWRRKDQFQSIRCGFLSTIPGVIINIKSELLFQAVCLRRFETHTDKQIDASESLDEENWLPEDVTAQREQNKHNNLNNYIAHCLQNHATNCKRFQVMDVSGKGKGLVALQDIIKHSFVCEYEGTLLDYNNGLEREQDYSKDETTTISFLFLLSYKGKKYWVDATRPNSGIGWFINHDLNPNTKMTCIEYEGKPKLIIFSIKPILKGFEISYDYGERRADVIRSNPFLKFTTNEEESRRVIENRQSGEPTASSSGGGAYRVQVTLIANTQ